MKEFRSFEEIPAVSPQESAPTETYEAVAEKMTAHERMLQAMGISPEDDSKLDPEDFFALAMLRCGYMGRGREFLGDSRKVILASTFQKAFIAYYGLTGPKKNVKYTEWFDQAHRDKKIDFIPHSRGKDYFLCLPVPKE